MKIMIMKEAKHPPKPVQITKDLTTIISTGHADVELDKEKKDDIIKKRDEKEPRAEEASGNVKKTCEH